MKHDIGRAKPLHVTKNPFLVYDFIWSYTEIIDACSDPGYENYEEKDDKECEHTIDVDEQS